MDTTRVFSSSYPFGYILRYQSVTISDSLFWILNVEEHIFTPLFIFIFLLKLAIVQMCSILVSGSSSVKDQEMDGFSDFFIENEGGLSEAAVFFNFWNMVSSKSEERLVTWGVL